MKRLLLLAGVLAALALSAGWAKGTVELRRQSTPSTAAPRLSGVVHDGAHAAFARVARRIAAWPSAAYTTADGKTITIYTSPSYVYDAAIDQTWVAFLGWLPHGDELNGLTVVKATADEVTAVCMFGDACYDPADGAMIVPGDESSGISIEQVLAHEYGHRIAAGRNNAPWEAFAYGAKHWATYANVCQRVQQGSAVPGDEWINYATNPGEAFADTYRELVGTMLAGNADWLGPNGVSAFLAPSFPNDFGAYDAVRADVTTPWTGPTTASWGGNLKHAVVSKKVRKTVVVKGKKQRRWVTVKVATGPVVPVTRKVDTPLDGVLEAKIADAPAGTSLGVYDASGATSLGPSGVQDLTFTVCGQRQVELVLRSPAAGAFHIALSVP